MIPVLQSTGRSSRKPFVVVLEKPMAPSRRGFSVAASLRITPELRTSGLLSSLPAEEVRSLLVLLTFVSQSGDCRAYLPQLCEALRLSPSGVKKRMGRLQQFRWEGEPLVYQTQSDSGLLTYTLNPRVRDIGYALAPSPDASIWNQEAASSETALQASNRDAVIATSRSAYGRSREEVERIVEEQLGHTPTTGHTPTGHKSAHDTRAENNLETEYICDLQRELESVGVSREQAGRLCAFYDDKRIRRQLTWLPYRNARNPGAFLVSAIEGNYHRPLSLRSTPRPLHTSQQSVSPSEPTLESHRETIGSDLPDLEAVTLPLP